MQREVITIMCEDGTQLAGELLIPTKPKAVVQFNAGTAAKRGVYVKFLTYLAEQGFLCCLWDYRGSGQSQQGSLKNSAITYSDYGVKDMPAVKDYLTQRFPELPFLIVAHSAGGQQIGFMSNWKGIGGVVNFGVSAAYFNYMPLAYRLQAYFFFYGVTPISALLKGYVAASALNLMEDLPSGVAFEWRDWLTVKDYFFDERFYGKTVPQGAFNAFDFPIHNYHASDDSISTPNNIRHFWAHIQSSAGITFDTLSPAQVGLNKIDHFGYFKSAMQETLWRDVVIKLNGFLAATH